MDCIIGTSQSIKTFCSAIGTLSKIGKDLYVEFDPIDSLIIHTLNDAKSAYSCFRFHSSFFEKCTGDNTNAINVQEMRQGQRMKTKSKSRTTNNDATSRKKQHSRKRPMEEQDPQLFCDDNRNDTIDDYEDNDDDIHEENKNSNKQQSSQSTTHKYLCRVPLRALASVVRPRRGVVSLRIRSENTVSPMVDEKNTTNTNTRSLRSFLSFEYQIIQNSNNNSSTSNNEQNNYHTEETILTVTHRIQIVNETSCQRAVIDKNDASEMIASPHVWLRLLDPVQIAIQQQHRANKAFTTSNEVALIVRNRQAQPTNDNGNPNIDGTTAISSVSATSFNYSTDTYQGLHQRRRDQNNGDNNTNNIHNNVFVQAANATLIKTETAIGSNELDEFDYVGNRRTESDENNSNHDSNVPPSNVNEQVVLVFCLKEAKAMLQFCATSLQHHQKYQSLSTVHDEMPLESNDTINNDTSVSLSFHWGGKPLIMEAPTPPTTTAASLGEYGSTNHASPTNVVAPVSATLVLATLDHNLLITERTMPEP